MAVSSVGHPIPPWIGDYQTVAASTTATLGPNGSRGDFIATIVIVPASTSPGAVQIKDGSGTAITVFAGGASSVADLKPIRLEIGAVSTAGAWSVITGANVSVFVSGKFS